MAIDNQDVVKNIKLYNFRRPDKFSKEHLKAIQDIHRDFVRHLASTLTAYLRMEVEIEVISIDQLTYEEYICSMPPHIQNIIFKLNPLSGEISMGISPEVLGVILDRMLGGAGVINNDGKELTQIEELLATKFTERVIRVLEDGWEPIINVKSEFVALANGYHSVPITVNGEIVVLTSFEIRLGQKTFGLMNICYPYPVLDMILPKLTSQYFYEHANVISNEIGRNENLEKIKNALVDMQVILGGTQIAINDVLELKKNDVIKLDQKLGEKLVARINGKDKFFVAPGAYNKKNAVKIIEQYYSEE